MSSRLLPLVVVICFLFGSPALACDISNYDRTPPSRISGKVDNGIVQFQWSTDVDTVDGRNWIWHYIQNTHDRGLGYKWPKAELRRALGSPLEPGKTDCNQYFVTGPTSPDDNAPIIYGTNDTSQRAVVFAETKTAEVRSTSSVIETSFRGSSGSIEDVRVVIATLEGKTDQDRWQLYIEQTPNVTVAISAPKLLSNNQVSVLYAQLRTTEQKFDTKVLAELYLENEIESRRFQSYLVMNERQKKIAAVVPAAALHKISSDLILLDRDARPFFATTVRLLAPDNTSK